MEFLNTPAFYMDDRFFDLFDEDEFLQNFANCRSPISVPPCRHHLARSSSEFREDEEEDLERHMKDIFPAVESEFPAVKLGFSAVESNLKPSIETSRKEKAAENENQVHWKKAMTTKCTEEYVPSSSKVRKKAATTASRSMIELQCLHCGVKKTSQWRAGPSGPKTLCNACGIRYNKSGRLCDEYRPANSPTFCPNLHSNFQRNIIQMRRHNSL